MLNIINVFNTFISILSYFSILKKYSIFNNKEVYNITDTKVVKNDSEYNIRFFIVIRIYIHC